LMFYPFSFELIVCAECPGLSDNAHIIVGGKYNHN
jgi:hypothetical protein